MFFQYGGKLSVKPGVQLMVIAQALFLHKDLDILVFVPLFRVNLIAADVDVRVREQGFHFRDQGVDKPVDILIERIHGGFVYAPAGLRPVGAGGGHQLGIGQRDSADVTGKIEFRHHADAQLARVFHHAADILLAIIPTCGTLSMQFRQRSGFNSPGLIIGQVPVQDIVFGRCHAIELALDGRDRKKAPRGIDQQPAPGIARVIDDTHRGQIAVAIVVERHQLQEGFQSVQCAPGRRRVQARTAGANLQAVALVVVEGRHGAGGRAVDCNNQRRPLSRG